MPVMQHPNQQMNQQQQQHQNQQQQQQAAQQQQAQQQQQQQQMNGPNAQFPFIHQQHHRQQNSKPKNKSCYLCGEQGHSAEHCSNEGDNLKLNMCMNLSEGSAEFRPRFG
jgi:hypothetical protein